MSHIEKTTLPQAHHAEFAPGSKPPHVVEDPYSSGSGSQDSYESPYAEHGPGIDHNIPQEAAVPLGPDLFWSRIRHTFREPLAEFFGVFVLILFGDGVVAQVVLSGGKNGSYQSINWGWG